MDTVHSGDQSEPWEIIFNPNGPHGSSPIYTVAAYKGGVGKTETAYELAYMLNAILVDLDWDKGNATTKWGYAPETRQRSPLLDALDAGRVPRPVKGKMKADLLPSHPDLVALKPDPVELSSTLRDWATTWDRPVVIDTHPGGEPWTLAAMAAATAVVVPTGFGNHEMQALEGMVKEVADYPLLLVPNKMPKVPPASFVDALERISNENKVPVGPPISHESWLPTRQRRMAVSASDPIPVRARDYVGQVKKLAKAVTSYGI